MDRPNPPPPSDSHYHQTKKNSEQGVLLNMSSVSVPVVIQGEQIRSLLLFSTILQVITGA
jgi:hypothetical protein